jgi:2-C-methyl-D-erythritol 2,4-cyclodiphosphate synthase
MARAMDVDLGRVAVKATTSEGLGYEGRQEGITVQAAALLGKF